MELSYALIGFAAGVILTAVAARVLVVVASRRARLAERRAKQAERLAEVGAMTGGLAHEIRNPLSTIGLNAQLLAEAVDELPVDDAERTRLSRRVLALKREAERLRDILEDFLRYAGAVHLDLDRTDLAETVEELGDFFLPQAQRHGARLRVEIVDRPLWARVDESLVKQALLNLMINAVQAMDRAQEEGPRELILRAHGGAIDGEPAAMLHVIDTGPGIDTERLPHIFRPYFTSRSGGSGLGLPVTRRLIEAHGGSVDVYTDTGKGADFTIAIPLESPRPATAGA